MLLDEIKLPVQQRSQKRLEQVLAVTKKILENEGIAACSIPEIALRANVPKVYIYQYFPTLNHLFMLLVKGYLEDLKQQIKTKSQSYSNSSIYHIMQDLITSTAEFYNQNRVASLLILGGPVHVEGFDLQEMVIEQMSEDIINMPAHHPSPLILEKPEHMLYLIEMIFALMKHSFYKYQTIIDDVLQESVNLCDLYLQNKGHNIH